RPQHRLRLRERGLRDRLPLLGGRRLPELRSTRRRNDRRRRQGPRRLVRPLRSRSSEPRLIHQLHPAPGERPRGIASQGKRTDMNKLTLSEWITADNGTRNEYLEQIIADAENEIAKQNAIIEWAREQISPATDGPVKHSIRWINTANLSRAFPGGPGVVVHGAECRDLDKIRMDPAVRAGLETISDPE